MDSIVLTNSGKEKFSAYAVRYFSLNGNEYFIFTLNEIDENNYVKLYAVRIETENGNKFAKNITDENEWTSVKKEIQIIVGNNRVGILNTKDMNHFELENLEINENRVFKLQSSIAEELSANKQNVVPYQNVDYDISNPDEKEPAISIETPSFVEHQETIETTNKVEEIMTEPQVRMDENSETIVDYKTLYEKILEKNNSLESENQRLTSENNNYKAKLDAIKNITN